MRPSHRLFMGGLFVALALLCVAVTKAQGMAMDNTFDHTTLVVPDPGDRYEPPADPPVESPVEDACPSRPHDHAPNEMCPFDYESNTYCNYNTGADGDPCPHADYGDGIWFFKCGQGSDPDTAGTVGVEFGWPETEPEGQADVTFICAGDWYSLSVGAP